MLCIGSYLVSKILVHVFNDYVRTADIIWFIHLTARPEDGLLHNYIAETTLTPYICAYSVYGQAREGHPLSWCNYVHSGHRTIHLGFASARGDGINHLLVSFHASAFTWRILHREGNLTQ
jgi:hypothetical protein